MGYQSPHPTMNRLQIYCLFLYILSISTAISADELYYSCNAKSKPNDYNIDNLLAKLVSGTIQNGFITSSFGQGDSQIFGLAQCRSDVTKTDCSSCILEAADRIRSVCPDQSDAKILYDLCVLRINPNNFFGGIDASGVLLYNVEDAEDIDVFNDRLDTLIDHIRRDAVREGNKGLGKGRAKVARFVTLYALVQCTRDLSDANCAQCLAIGISYFPKVCNNKKGCRVVLGSCYLRYEVYPFFFPLSVVKRKVMVARSSVGYKSVVAPKP